MSKNHPKIYTKPQNIGECSKRRDLVLLETWTRYWHKGQVERRENSLQVKSHLNSNGGQPITWDLKTVAARPFVDFFLSLPFLCANFVLLWQTSGIVQLDVFHLSITRISLPPQKQATVAWLERLHAFLHLRILVHSRTKRPLKTMKEWVRQRKQTDGKIKAFRVKTLYRHSSDE